jgi:hypothetical protein
MNNVREKMNFIMFCQNLNIDVIKRSSNSFYLRDNKRSVEIGIVLDKDFNFGYKILAEYFGKIVKNMES